MDTNDESSHAFVIDVKHLFLLKCTNLIRVISSFKNENKFICKNVLEFHDLEFHRRNLL